MAEEIRFWSANCRNTEINKILGTFQEVQNILNQAKAGSQNEARTRINQAIQRERANYTIYSRTPIAKFLVSLTQKDSPETVNGALGFLAGEIQQQRIASPRFLTGVVKAILFTNPSAVSEVLAANQSTFEDTRSKLNSIREELIAKTETFTASIDSWRAESELKFSQMLDSKRGEFDKTRKEEEEKYSEWQKQSADSLTDWQERMKGLQSAYTEKLKLEGPTKYWVELEKGYLKTGRIWIASSTLSVLAMAWLTYRVIYNPPEILKEAGFSASGVRGSILLVVLISVVVYLITLFVKIATSAYHLARDARERHQLTLVYLALTKDAGVKDDDRKIILQSLFSRADTGLLRGDAGPAMPGTIGNIVELIKGK